VGEGVVRAYLEAGADVVVPTRSASRAEEFRGLLGPVAGARLHLVEHDYTTFDGAEQLVEEMTKNLGGIDHVIAPIGGWWAGKRLWEIDNSDWQGAFVGLATAHMAVARAAVPRISAHGTYQTVVGESAGYPVPGSGLVSMEQAAVLMMLDVLAAENQSDQRLFALVLGPVRTRAVVGDDTWVSADQIGAVSVAAAIADHASGHHFLLRNRAEADVALKASS
jgi:3-oxoacyl-[acyl-carrier protein] reductase